MLLLSSNFLCVRPQIVLAVELLPLPVMPTTTITLRVGSMACSGRERQQDVTS